MCSSLIKPSGIRVNKSKDKRKRSFIIIVIIDGQNANITLHSLEVIKMLSIEECE